jgi:PKD repeat protein
MVYLNGLFLTNVTKGAETFTASSLTPATSYEIETHTVGTTGLINSTWINNTAMTAPEPPVNVPKLPGQKNAPTDIDDNGKYEDMNGDGKFDLTDVGLYSRYYSTLQRNGQSDLFDYTGDGKIDYRDVLWIVQKYVTGIRRR